MQVVPSQGDVSYRPGCVCRQDVRDVEAMNGRIEVVGVTSICVLLL
jgi:hypothetical protein